MRQLQKSIINTLKVKPQIDPQCLVRLDEIINCFHGVRFIRLFAIWQPDRDELVVLVRCFLSQLFHGQLT